MTVARVRKKTRNNDLRREMSGVLIIAVGILGYLGLIFPASGVLGRDLGRGLSTVFGFLAWLVPGAVIVTGILRLMNRPSLSRRQRIWGALLAYLGATLLLGFGGHAIGGIMGLHLLAWSALVLGHPGSLILGLVLLVLGAMLITGGSLARGSTQFGEALLTFIKTLLRGLVLAVRWLRDWLFPLEPDAGEPIASPVRPDEGSMTRESAPAKSRPVRETIPEPRSGPPRDTEPAPVIQPAVFWRGRDPYLPPPLSLLIPPAKLTPSRGQSAETRGQILVDSLRQFGIDVTLGEVSQGPTITRFEIVPPRGVKVARILNLADDIALSLAATGVRIAPIPGKSAIGIEVPNDQISPVLLRDVLESDAFSNAASPLTVALGRDVAGLPIVAQLEQMPHLLVAGATGSGKSVLINVLITSLLLRSSPEVVRLLLIDPKVVELAGYNGIPHLISPVVTEPKKAAGALRWAVQEMERRYRLFASQGVRDVARYNETVEQDEDKLALIVIIIDELADLMMVAPQDVEESIARLAQMARAAGLHLVVATQRPSVDVITGTIKANIPSRIAFAVSSQVDSRTILDTAGAEKLLGRGDMLYSPVGSAKPVRVQGALVTEKEIESVVHHLRQSSHSQSPAEVPDFSAGRDDPGDTQQETDSLFYDALRIVVESRQASTSMLQRRMRIGYTRAARLIDSMESRGYISAADGARPREVFLTADQVEKLIGDHES